jgi:hypothetical protein
MLSVLQQFQTYLPKTWNDKYDGQLFAGDQLSVERAVNTISSVANRYTPEDRLEGINLQLGDWHASVKLLTVSVPPLVLFKLTIIIHIKNLIIFRRIVTLLHLFKNIGNIYTISKPTRCACRVGYPCSLPITRAGTRNSPQHGGL